MKTRILLIASWRSVLVQDITKLLSNESCLVIAAHNLEQGLKALNSSVFQAILVIESSDMALLPEDFNQVKVALQVTPIILLLSESGSFFRNYTQSILDQKLPTDTDAAMVADIAKEVVMSTSQSLKIGSLSATPLPKVLSWVAQTKICGTVTVELAHQSFQIQVSDREYELQNAADAILFEKSLEASEGSFSIQSLPESSVILGERAHKIHFSESSGAQKSKKSLQSFPINANVVDPAPAPSQSKNMIPFWLVGASLFLAGLWVGRWSNSRVLPQNASVPEKTESTLALVPIQPTSPPPVVETPQPIATEVLHEAISERVLPENPIPSPSPSASQVEVVKSESDVFRAHLTRGKRLLDLGDFVEARVALDKAYAINRNHADLQLAIGTLCSIEGKFSLAKQFYETYLKLVKPSSKNNEQIAEVKKVLKEMR